MQSQILFILPSKLKKKKSSQFPVNLLVSLTCTPVTLCKIISSHKLCPSWILSSMSEPEFSPALAIPSVEPLASHRDSGLISAPFPSLSLFPQVLLLQPLCALISFQLLCSWACISESYPFSHLKSKEVPLPVFLS